MRNKFDKILSDKFRETFENFEVEFKKEDWAKFQEKYNQSDKSSILNASYFFKAAAVLVISISCIYLWQELKEAIIYKESTAVNTPGLSSDSLNEAEPKSTIIDSIINNGQPISNLGTLTASNQSSDERENSQFTNEVNLNEIDSSDNAYHETSIIGIASIDLEADDLLGIRLSEKTTFLKKTDNQDSIFIATDPKGGIDRRLNISVLASTLLSYSGYEEGAPMGFAGGVSADIPLNDQLSISSGITLIKQDLQVGGNNKDISLESSTDDIEVNIFADLLIVDIPLNVNYSFAAYSKNEPYVSIGVSSFWYAKQSFQTSTKQVIEIEQENEDGSIELVRNVQTNSQTGQSRNFSSIDIAKVLNISAGYKFSITPDVSMAFEPYLKYPLSKITDNKLSFTSSGFSIKVSFN